PSLDEMAYVAKEMQRRGLNLPLLIGGATTSKAHTAVKIAPSYQQAVVHVLDASRAVGVVGSLINPVLKVEFARKNREEQEKLRHAHAATRERKTLISLDEARKRRTPIEWKVEDIAKPSFTGSRVLKDFPLEKIVPFIDWSPFFHAWELRGRYPGILKDEKFGSKAQELFDDAQGLLKAIVDQKLLRAHAVYGFFPANSIGDDIELYTDDSRTEVLTTFHALRQQMEKQPGEFNHALSDFIAPKETGLKDYLGVFAVTAGEGTEDLCRKFEKDHDDYNSIMTKALADRLAEAFAECLHKQAREDFGYGQAEKLTSDDLIHEEYRGIRPAPGYPACPDHTEKQVLWKLLDIERSVGIKLTESCAMWPASSVSGWYFAHPKSKYFGVGKLGRDQVLDYHLRKGMRLEEVERWLSPYLDYDPNNNAPRGGNCGCGNLH
ncbi:MAG TPA: vitamin B12 dependent-methionine synthase activation domain-containing protein, partial [Verrucomicrobiae bacterium]|nr:vitamin B12 dependent-methionine synthase activation domain-containing protein [Verrucomicrobiae bacterium]